LKRRLRLAVVIVGLAACIAAPALGDTLYVSTSVLANNSGILKITADGHQSLFFANRPEWGGVEQLALDRSGDVWAATNVGDVLKITPDGSASLYARISDFAVNFALAFDSHDTLYANGFFGIYRVQPGNTSTYVYRGPVLNTQSLAFDANDNLIFGDSYKTISKMDPSFHVTSHSFADDPLFTTADNLAVDSQGNILVASSQFTGKIIRVAPDNTVTTFAQFAPSLGNPHRFSGIAVGSAGMVYATDPGDALAQNVLAIRPDGTLSQTYSDFLNNHGGLVVQVPEPESEALALTGALALLFAFLHRRASRRQPQG
jgi:hypothetical protein